MRTGSTLDIKKIGHLRAQFRLDKRKMTHTTISSSEDSISSIEEPVNTVHPGVTAKKILETYKKGKIYAVSELMSQKWTSKHHYMA
jgi:hypothetical protein